MLPILYRTDEREVLIRNKNSLAKEDLTQIQDCRQYKQTAENETPIQITTDEIYVYRSRQKGSE
jgi:hypothetical protein